MQDNERRSQQWLRLLPEFLVPIYGGQKEKWAESNTEVLRRQMPLFIEGTGFPEVGGFVKTRRALAVESVQIMFDYVGIAPPKTDDDCYDLYQSYTDHVINRVHADIPGAVDAIRSLSASGYRLYTASGTGSAQLQLMLDVMGIRHLFTQMYGPDLVDTHKGGSNYYRLVLEHAGESPDGALFIDDSSKCVSWAQDAGATAVLVSKNQPDANSAVQVVPDLAALPLLLEFRKPEPG